MCRDTKRYSNSSISISAATSRILTSFLFCFICLLICGNSGNKECVSDHFILKINKKKKQFNYILEKTNITASLRQHMQKILVNIIERVEKNLKFFLEEDIFKCCGICNHSLYDHIFKKARHIYIVIMYFISDLNILLWKLICTSLYNTKIMLFNLSYQKN